MKCENCGQSIRFSHVAGHQEKRWKSLGTQSFRCFGRTVSFGTIWRGAYHVPDISTPEAAEEWLAS